MLELCDLSLGYSRGKLIVKGISLQLPDTGVYALMGPSGSGKTTLLKSLAGLLPALSGSIRGMEGSKRGILFQEDRLLPWCSALQNVAIALPDSDTGKAESLLKSLGIEDVHALARTFSGGMRRRVALARAMAFAPRYLFLDEPFSGMDMALKQRISPLVRCAAPFMLFSTHDMSDAQFMCAQVLMLSSNALEKI